MEKFPTNQREEGLDVYPCLVFIDHKPVNCNIQTAPIVVKMPMRILKRYETNMH